MHRPCCGSASVAQPPVVVKEEACTAADKNCISTDYRKVTLQWSLARAAVSSAVSSAPSARGARPSCGSATSACAATNAVKVRSPRGRRRAAMASQKRTTYSYTVNLLPGTGYRFRVSVLGVSEVGRRRERRVLDDRLHRGHGASVYMRQCDVQLICSLLHVEFEPVRR